jgi:ABC-type phosphate transport system substrate-binding protein
MNGKQLACVILMILIGFMTYGLQIFNNKARQRQMEAEDAVAEAEAAATEADLMHTILEKVQFEATELRKFLGEWAVLIDRLGSRQEVETAILSINRDSNIFVLSQRFEDKANPNQKMEPLRAEFIRYVYSKEGQSDVIRAGFFPLVKAIADEDLKAFGLR